MMTVKPDQANRRSTAEFLSRSSVDRRDPYPVEPIYRIHCRLFQVILAWVENSDPYLVGSVRRIHCGPLQVILALAERSELYPIELQF